MYLYIHLYTLLQYIGLKITSEKLQLEKPNGGDLFTEKDKTRIIPWFLNKNNDDVDDVYVYIPLESKSKV